ncbi:MAG TPA: WG repeat-containing protein, partial [Planctomycetia bacterium]|nr:WG repeat-containing protein [Planctomycetia bacterium]
MRRRIWLAISLAFLVLAGWLAFLQFEPRLFPVPDHELIVLAEFERLSHLYISAAGRVVEGKWFPIGDFDSAGMARVLGTPQDTDRILDDAGGDPSALQSYFGWIDRAGRVAIPCDWHDAHDFDDQGWAAVKRSGKWGWIDRAGVVVIAPGWQSFDRFDAKGEALVRDSDGCWIVD